MLVVVCARDPLLRVWRDYNYYVPRVGIEELAHRGEAEEEEEHLQISPHRATREWVEPAESIPPLAVVDPKGESA